MIPIIRFNEFILELIAYVNAKMAENSLVWRDGMWVYTGDTEETPKDATVEGKKIDDYVIGATETHIMKKLKDKKGIIFAADLAPSDTELQDIDNYSENNNEIFFVLEKVDPGRMTDNNEQYHYTKLQLIMKYVKEYIVSRGLNGNMCGGEETLTKNPHTEWEYNQFGGYNGLSVSFDLKDWEL